MFSSSLNRSGSVSLTKTCCPCEALQRFVRNNSVIATEVKHVVQTNTVYLDKLLPLLLVRPAVCSYVI